MGKEDVKGEEMIDGGEGESGEEMKEVEEKMEEGKEENGGDRGNEGEEDLKRKGKRRMGVVEEDEGIGNFVKREVEER